MHISTDIGGTFTDFVVFDSGKLVTFKVPSTPSRPDHAVEHGLSQIFARRPSSKPGPRSFFSHGTTVATNTAIERKGARTAIVTTKGFPDILEIGRQTRPSLYDFTVTRPKPLVPRELCFEVSERVDADGNVIRELDKDGLRKLINRLNNLNRTRYKNNPIEAVAVCLLFSFLNPRHEKSVASAIRKSSKLIPVLSSEVLPEFREYERFSTTVLEAYLKTTINKYLKNLTRICNDFKLRNFYMMQSNGGVATAKAVRKRVINTLLSGPAAGVAASKYLGEVLGLENLITFDMGGTSTDVSTIVNGELQCTSEGAIAQLPLSIPILDIVTIGAGGGSIAWIDTGGALRVGPQSAGAEPGPICYGYGGKGVTVTDCDLLAGYLNPNYFLDGEMTLDHKLALGLTSAFAKKYQLGLNQTISGVIKVVNSNMERALRKVSVERGFDPREFAMVAFGGAGPVHAAILAKELNIPEVIVPWAPGVFSAVGMLVSDIRSNYSKTRVISGNDGKVDNAVEKILAQHIKRAKKELKLQNLSLEKTKFIRSVDMRYKGQSYEINVDYIDDIEKLKNRFHEKHKRYYGYSTPERELEIVNIRLNVITAREKPKIMQIVEKRLNAGRKTTIAKVTEYRNILFEPDNARVRTPVYRRSDLGSGFKNEGPIVIEDPSSTIVVYPEMEVQVDKFGNIHIYVR